jgi:CRISPR/Cas system-associated protein Csx1
MDYRRIDNIVDKEQKNSKPDNHNTINSSVWYLYTSIGLTFTTIANTTDNNWMYAPAVGFCLAGAIDASAYLFRKK